MSFRKRNVVVASPGRFLGNSEAKTVERSVPGTRPSPLDGRLTTSTGTQSLDTLLAGHAGLALGSSLLIEESGATDFGGALLRYYAAEGILQGHHVHVLGMHEGWGRELPGLSITSEGHTSKTSKSGNDDRMKIAWRYERLGEFGRDRGQVPASSVETANAAIFCHDLDLSKRLTLPSESFLKCVPMAPQTLLSPGKATASPISPFHGFLQYLRSHISAAAPTTIHRVIVPTILSPALYSSDATNPDFILQFFHSLRALLRSHPLQLSAMLTLPLSLFPRSSGMVRWVESLSDGVLELAPFPSVSAPLNGVAVTGSSGTQEDPPQGVLRVHRLPVFNEKGGGGGDSRGVGDDLAFTLSRRKGLVIKPYSLPPVEGDTDAQEQRLATDHGTKATKVEIEF